MFNNIVTTIVTRDNAKSALSLVINLRVAAVTEDALITNTTLEEDSIRVTLASKAAGTVIAVAARPTSDKIVDKIADTVQSIRDHRTDKKNKKTEKK